MTVAPRSRSNDVVFSGPKNSRSPTDTNILRRSVVNENESVCGLNVHFSTAGEDTVVSRGMHG